MRISIGDLRILIKEELNVTSGGWYHLSFKDLGDEFVFTPRIPLTPYQDIDQDVIEDDHTKRTSWAPSIHDAVKALEYVSGRTSVYVYYTDDLPGEVDLQQTFDDCPASPDNDYGEKFNKKNWLSYTEKHAGRKLTADEIDDEFTACVPDALATKEHWATEPVTAKKIGTYRSGKFVPL